MDKKNKLPIIGIIISFIISLCLTFIENSDTLFNKNHPVEAYRIYLKGQLIGLIESEDELYKYINSEQQELKNKYNVENVYIPNEIDVVKDVTYQKNLSTINEIYNSINEKTPFTIKGYVVTIDKTDTIDYPKNEIEGTTDEEEIETDNEPKIININVLDKEIFTNAVKKTVLAFIDENDYEDFVNQIEKTLDGTGELIENLYIEDKVSIKDAYISVNEKIYTDEDELTQYLLFGENNQKSSYTVKAGDTIEEIANNNKMNVNELLIANDKLKSSSTLLYEGQNLTIGVLDPVFTMVEVKHLVEDQTIAYKTEYIYDNSKLVGYQQIQTPGSNGITRVTQKLKVVNGDTVSALISSSEEIKPVVNEVIVKGGKKPTIVSAGNWGWPTNIPYIISSHYGWRWGRLHYGVDICGTGHGSPLYAAKSGIVTEVNYHYSSGYYVVINHQNGYYSRYAHMVSLSRYVKVGDYVNMGDVIGDMGNSGNSFGTHLHFEIWYGKPYASGSQSYNPLLFY